MGGLIVRSYLAGKVLEGGFAPPAETRIRKLVFLGTPHFGSAVAALGTPNPQLQQLQPGSAFLADLATWNQGIGGCNCCARQRRQRVLVDRPVH
jgi:hypothetical protein